jgi:hypothetical protein
MRAEADSAMAHTDTERELARLRIRRRREVARRRTTALVAVASAAVVAVAGLVARPAAHRSPPTDHQARPPVLRLDEVPAPSAEVRPVGMPTSARVVLTGRVDGLEAEPDGRWWVLTEQPSTQEWTLSRLGPDHRTVEVRARFASKGSLWGAPWATATDDVRVLALPEGGPLPAAERFSDRHDGLLRLDRRTGRVLGFTPVDRATTVEAAADGTVWAPVAPDRVADIDPTTGRVLRSFPTPGLVDRVLVQGDRLWLAYQEASPTRAWQVDARTGAVLLRVTMPDQAIHVPDGNGGVVVVRPDGRVVRVAPDGSATAVQLGLPDGLVVGDASVSGGDVWLWVGGSLLVRLSATTLAVTGAVAVPWLGPGPLSRTGEHLLLGDPSAGLVQRVPLRGLICSCPR